MLNLDTPLIVFLSLPASFLIALFFILLRKNILINNLLAKAVLIPLGFILSIGALILFVDLNQINNLSQKVLEDAYSGLSIYLMLAPLALLYNFLFWKNLDLEIGPSKKSFPLWLYQRGLVFYLLGFILAVNYIESFIEVFSITSGASALILSIGIPVAFSISIAKIALEDLNKWREEKERLTESFESSLKPFIPGEGGSYIVFVFDSNSQLSKDIDQVLSQNKDLYSLDTNEYPDFANKNNLVNPPLIVAVVDDEIIFGDGDNYSITRVESNLKKAKRQINLYSAHPRREKESENKDQG